jgi:branched-subunit amino acid transport protein AzlD
MSETLLQWHMGIKLLVITSFAMCYGFGGINNKWLRRYLGPAILLAFLLWTTREYLSIAVGLTLPIVLSMGYGVNSKLMRLFNQKLTIPHKLSKYITRGVVALLSAACFIPVAVITGLWSSLLLHTILILIALPFLGVRNPTGSARAEETLIGVFYVLIPVFMV